MMLFVNHFELVRSWDLDYVKDCQLLCSGHTILVILTCTLPVELLSYCLEIVITPYEWNNYNILDGES